MYYVKKPEWSVPESEVTPKRLYKNRRQFIKAAGLGTIGLAACSKAPGNAGEETADADAAGVDFTRLPGAPLSYDERAFVTEGESEQTPFEAVTTYNNYYEFGLDKGDPARNAGALPTQPWSITVEGHVNNPGTYAVEDLVDFNALEERIYRLRCVEAWSMVIPWIGVPLAPVIEKLGPTSRARFIQFETFMDRDVMPGLSSPVLNWPYVEGLRLDEAVNELTFLAVGLYGETLLGQNGAPVRLVVPWKYGFKSIKSIVAIRFVEDQPRTAWNDAQPGEYGFYSNVNPEVDHPRWSQATERRIGEFRRRETLMFNGYGEQVAGLYAGMDLRKNF